MSYSSMQVSIHDNSDFPIIYKGGEILHEPVLRLRTSTGSDLVTLFLYSGAIAKIREALVEAERETEAAQRQLVDKAEASDED